MSEKYLVIYCDEDGDVTVEELTKEEILRRRNEPGYYSQEPEILGNIPYNDPNYWNGGMLIIKGQIVTDLSE